MVSKYLENANFLEYNGITSKLKEFSINNLVIITGKNIDLI